jgi:hypothetical protein
VIYILSMHYVLYKQQFFKNLIKFYLHHYTYNTYLKYFRYDAHLTKYQGKISYAPIQYVQKVTPGF